MEDDWRESPETEGTFQLLQRGFWVWSNNLKIAVPVLLQTVLVMGWTGTALAALFLTNTPPESLVEAATVGDPLALQGAMTSYLESAVPYLTALLPIWFIGALLVTAFFDAGTIGMSVEANELYRTSVDDAFRYGKKYLVDMFLADLLALLIVAAVLGLFFVPAALAGLTFLAPLAFLPLLVVGFLLLPVRYALVADGLGPVQAVRRGAQFAIDQPMAILLLFLATAIINLAVGVPGQVISTSGTPSAAVYANLYSFAAQALFLGPFATVLWTRLYLNRTGKRIVENRSTETFTNSQR